jgi:hypothetical protein
VLDVGLESPLIDGRSIASLQRKGLENFPGFFSFGEIERVLFVLARLLFFSLNLMSIRTGAKD